MEYDTHKENAACDMTKMRELHATLMTALRAFSPFVWDGEALTDLIIRTDQEIGDLISHEWVSACREAGEDESVPKSQEQVDWIASRRPQGVNPSLFEQVIGIVTQHDQTISKEAASC